MTQKQTIATLLLLLLFSTFTASAAFPTKREFPSALATDSAQVVTSQIKVRPPVSNIRTLSKMFFKKDHSFKGGFEAYLAVGLGILGFAFFSLHTTFLMMLFGLAAGVSGKLGLKRYKHDKLLTSLCYVGIVLGGLLVIFATIPILFLL